MVDTVGKMITKHLTGKGEMWPLVAAVAANEINVLQFHQCLVLLHFNWFLRKPLDLLNLTFTFPRTIF